jgi:hypothetical protein
MDKDQVKDVVKEIGKVSADWQAKGKAMLMRRILGLFAALGTAAFLFGPTSASAAAPLVLGTSANFGALAGSTVTNTGPTAVTGDVGVFAGAAIVGFPPGTLTGALHGGDAVAGTAQGDLTTAYTTAGGTACNTDLTGLDLGGMTLTPGVYCFATSAQLTGILTLNFLGDPNAVFLFQTGSTLTTASASSVVAINTGGAACLPNINWQIGSSATLGSTSHVMGNVLAQSSITLNTGASLDGRALARTGAVTMDTNTVGAVGCGGGGGGGGGGGVTSVPTLQEWSLILLGLMLAAVGGWYYLRQTARRI